jgi:hypothetical protein
MDIDEIRKNTLSPEFVEKNLDPGVNPGQPEVIQDSRPVNLARSESILEQPKELGGRIGPNPTRYGDWEKNGRCIDF